jgi:hypothetical protein
MPWLILVIIIVGYFVIRAIRQNSHINIAIAQQSLESTPEYRERYAASVEFLEYKEQYQINLGHIYQAKVSLLEKPDMHSSEKKRLEGLIKKYERENRSSKAAISRKYEDSPYNPFTNLSPDAYVQNRFHELEREAREELDPLYSKVRELDRAKL